MLHSTDHRVTVAILCQVLLLVYHQVTTHIDFYPFNGARYYSQTERLAEGGINLVLMSLAPVGFALHVHALMIYGAKVACINPSGPTHTFIGSYEVAPNIQKSEARAGEGFGNEDIGIGRPVRACGAHPYGGCARLEARRATPPDRDFLHAQQ